MIFGNKEDPRIGELTKEVSELKQKVNMIEHSTIRIEETLKPVKSLVYGATALILVGVMGAALATIGLS